MSRRLAYALIALLFLTISAPLYAQNGCVNSPENPTALLALVGTACAWIMHRRQR